MKIYILLFKYQKLLFKILHQRYLVRKDVREKHDTVGKDVKDSFILLKDLGLFFFHSRLLENIYSTMFLVVLMLNQMFSSGTLKPAKVLLDKHFGFKIGSRFTDSKNGQSLNSSFKKKSFHFLL